MVREWLGNESGKVRVNEWTNERIMEVKLKPEFRMFCELHGRIGNWIYKTRRYPNGERKIFAYYSPKEGDNPNPEFGKLF